VAQPSRSRGDCKLEGMTCAYPYICNEDVSDALGHKWCAVLCLASQGGVSIYESLIKSVTAQEAFDAQGRFWWITWTLPNLRKKRGNPAHFLGAQPAQPAAYNGLPVSTSMRSQMSDDFDAMV